MTDLKKAALIYGSTEQHIRIAAQQEKIPFAYYLKKDGKRMGSYKINFFKLREFIGNDEWEAGSKRVEEELAKQEVG